MTHTPLMVPSLFLVTASGSSGVNEASSTPPSSSITGLSRPPEETNRKGRQWEKRGGRKKVSVVVTVEEGVLGARR